jgi:hypothetical protein
MFVLRWFSMFLIGLIFFCSNSLGQDIAFPLFLDAKIDKGKTSVWTPMPAVAINELKEECFNQRFSFYNNTDLERWVDNESITKAIFPKKTFDQHVSVRPVGARDFEVWQSRHETMLIDEVKVLANLSFRSSFKLPFASTRMHFVDPSGCVENVSAFGLNYEPNEEIRRQAEILYYENSDSFSVALKTTNNEFFIVMTSFESFPESLLDGYLKSEDKASKSKKEQFRYRDQLRVPELKINRTHRYPELENQRIRLGKSEDSYLLSEAKLVLDMKLTRFGVDMESSYILRAKIGVDDTKFCVFDSPFLIYLKKKDSAKPFFAAWVSEVTKQRLGELNSSKRSDP